MTDYIIHGGCLCGALRYQLPRSAVTKATHCHCDQCRKQSGALVWTVVHTTPKYFKWTVNDDIKPYSMPPEAYKTFSSSPGILRGFCRECGSPMTWQDTKRTEMEVLIGTIDDIPAAGLQITHASYASREIPGWEIGPKDVERDG